MVKKKFIEMNILRNRLYPIGMFLNWIGCNNSSSNDVSKYSLIDSNLSKAKNSANQILADYSYASSYDLNDSNLFIFLKSVNNWKDSWVYIIKESNESIDIEYRFIPSFLKTGYGSYQYDKDQFLFYECYKMRLSKVIWDSLISESQIAKDSISDTMYDKDRLNSPIEYVLWYKGKLLIYHIDSKYLSLFKGLEISLANNILRKIEYRKNNPINKFGKGQILPRNYRVNPLDTLQNH